MGAGAVPAECVPPSWCACQGGTVRTSSAPRSPFFPVVGALMAGLALAACSSAPHRSAARHSTGTRPRATVSTASTSTTAAAGSSTTTTAPAGTTTTSGGGGGPVSACDLSHLQGSTQGSPRVAAGTVQATFTLSNRAGPSCTVHGLPSLTLVDSAGHQLVTHETPSGGPGATVTLGPGATASFTVAFRNLPGQGASCPSAAKVIVSLPGQPGSTSVATSLAPCGGVLVVTPLR